MGLDARTLGVDPDGDIDGNGVDEALALDGNALQAWSYGANAWRQLPASPSLTLTGDWLTKPEYYATIRVGDVDGDGRDDVVARGPFGIRTWFYDRRGSGRVGALSARGLPGLPRHRHDAVPEHGTGCRL